MAVNSTGYADKPQTLVSMQLLGYEVVTETFSDC